MYGQIQSCLRYDVHQTRQYLQCILAIPEHHQIVSYQIGTEMTVVRYQIFELSVRCTPIGQSKAIACLQIDGDRTVRMLYQIQIEHLLRYVVIIEFVVAKSYVDV